jgi:hypothetical protein
MSRDTLFLTAAKLSSSIAATKRFSLQIFLISSSGIRYAIPPCGIGFLIAFIFPAFIHR